MTRRISLALAFMAVATITLFTGVASAQTGSPPAVAGTVVEVAPELPRTGSSGAIPMTIGAIALLMIGIALVLATRRRKGNEPTTA